MNTFSPLYRLLSRAESATLGPMASFLCGEEIVMSSSSCKQSARNSGNLNNARIVTTTSTSSFRANQSFQLSRAIKETRDSEFSTWHRIYNHTCHRLGRPNACIIIWFNANSCTQKLHAHTFCGYMLLINLSNVTVTMGKVRWVVFYSYRPPYRCSYTG